MDKKLPTNNNNNNNSNNDISMSTPPPPSSLTTSSSSASTDNLNQLDNLSNLIINNSYQRQQQYTSYLTADEHDNALLDKYEYDMSKHIQENYLSDKEQASQKLFQSFQTSACAVTQMFKDNTVAATTTTTTTTTTASISNATSTLESDDVNNKQPKAQSPQLTQWQSFQNSAGAITVLYKDSLEACKTHYDLGLMVGQHRKLKELMTWLKKKKRRTIRKDELINFLIGNISSETSNFNDNNPNTTNSNNNTNNNNTVNNSNNSLNKNLSSSSNSSFNTMNTQTNTSSMFFNTFSSSNTTAPLQHNNPFLSNPFNSSKRMHNSVANTVNLQQHPQPIFGSGAIGLAPSRLASNLNTTNNTNSTNTTISTTTTSNVNASLPSNDTNSDLATFREALIMHNRSRDAPPNHHVANSQHHNASTHPNAHHNNQNINSTHHHNAHHHHHNPHHHMQAHQQQIPPPGSIGSTLNCDDLDCFFCEQIATHIEHKRSAANSNINFDMGESPTRKRGRFV